MTDVAPQTKAARPHVCHIIHDDGDGGGPQAVIDQLHALTSDFEQSVLHGGSGGIAAACDAMRIRHYQLPIEKLSKLPLGFVALIGRLIKLRPNIVLLQGQWAGAAGAVAAAIARVPRTLYFTLWPAFYTDWGLSKTIRNRIAEGIPCRLASRVVAPTESTKSAYLLRRLVPEGRIAVLPYSIDLSRIPSGAEANALRQNLGWDSAHVHVVSVARLADQKRIDWLLRSWAIVAPHAPHARLWIVGDGPERKRLEQLVDELQISRSCKFLGAQANGIGYMAAADIVAMTSMYETFGFAALEAMACGKPLVASRVDGIVDLVTDGTNGFLVAPGDLITFSDRLRALVADVELRNRFGSSARQRARDFEAARLAPEYVHLVTSSIGPRL